MLGLEINGEKLDLSPGTRVQMERSSPFFSNTDFSGEYSLPLILPYTPKNARLLGLPNHYYTRRTKTKVAAKMYDGNNFSYAGELVITGAKLHINDVSRSAIHCTFITGVSAFWSQVQNKKLKALELGGVRSFTWTNNDPSSANKGFWQHIHATLDGSQAYSFAPIRNDRWSGGTEEGSADWMNKLDNAGNLDYNNNFNTLAPQVSIKYLLESIFEEHGWTFDTDSMEDEQWKIMFMPSFYAVSWQKIIQVGGPPYFDYSPLATITINLQNHVPPEMYITNFLIALASRFNWGFDFNSSRKICRMFPLKDLANGTKKDWTAYMPADWDSNFSEDTKVFAFRNDIDSADSRSSAPDFTKITYGDAVISEDDLPAAAESNFNLVIFAWKDNRYFQCRYSEEENVYFWDDFAPNIYNYEPDGHNQEIVTEASTMPVYKTLYRTNGVTDYYGYFPLCEQEGNWEGKAGDFVPWGLRILFHRGMVWEANPLGNKGQQQYPYLTSIAFTITQEEPDLAWSNVYKHTCAGVEKGIVDYWFRETLKFLEQGEVNSGTLILPRTVLINFAWSDVILLRNIPYVVQKITDVIEYGGTVPVEMRRIG